MLAVYNFWNVSYLELDSSKKLFLRYELILSANYCTLLKVRFLSRFYMKKRHMI